MSDDDDEENEMGTGAEGGKEGEGDGEETKELNPEDGQVASSILSKVRGPPHFRFHFNGHSYAQL